jgi:hypothetical protein
MGTRCAWCTRRSSTALAMTGNSRREHDRAGQLVGDQPPREVLVRDRLLQELCRLPDAEAPRGVCGCRESLLSPQRCWRATGFEARLEARVVELALQNGAGQVEDVVRQAECRSPEPTSAHPSEERPNIGIACKAHVAARGAY